MSLKDEEALKALEKLQRTIDSVESKIDIMKDEITDSLEAVSKDLHNLDAFAHNILEQNQKTLYQHMLKLEGQETEEEEEK